MKFKAGRKTQLYQCDKTGTVGAFNCSSGDTWYLSPRGLSRHRGDWHSREIQGLAAVPLLYLLPLPLPRRCRLPRGGDGGARPEHSAWSVSLSVGNREKTRQGRDSPQHKGTQGHIQTGRRGRGVRTETQIRPLQTQVSLANAAMTEPLLSLSPSHATVA